MATGQHSTLQQVTSHNSIRLHEPPVMTACIATAIFRAWMLACKPFCLLHLNAFGIARYLGIPVFWQTMCIVSIIHNLLSVMGYMQHSYTGFMVATPQPSLDNSTQPCAHLYVQPCTLWICSIEVGPQKIWGAGSTTNLLQYSSKGWCTVHNTSVQQTQYTVHCEVYHMMVPPMHLKQDVIILFS